MKWGHLNNYQRHWLYVIAEDVAPQPAIGPVKIGISRDPLDRVSSLQSGCPSGALYVVRAFGFRRREMAHSLEQHFHKWRKADRRHREWFNLKPEDAVELVRRHIFLSITEDNEPNQLLEEIIWDDTEHEFTDLSEYA